MQASGGNHIAFSASLWPYHYHSIDKLNPRLICIASPLIYSLLFSPLHTIKSNNSFFGAAAATNCEDQSDSLLPVRASQWKDKVRWKSTTWLLSPLFNLRPYFEIIFIILVDFSQKHANCFAIKARLVQWVFYLYPTHNIQHIVKYIITFLENQFAHCRWNK